MPICWKKLEQVAKKSPQKAYACLTRGVQQIFNFEFWTTPNSRIVSTYAEANIQTHALPSFFDSPVSQSAWLLYSLPNREGTGLNIKEPIDYETEYGARLTACAPLEYEDRAIAHLTQERITNDQRITRLNKI